MRHNLSHSPKLVILSVFSALVLLTVLRLHGFSDGAWDGILGPSETSARIISGVPQPIRSDDWAVNLTFMKAQLKHEPKFPVINTLIGDGQNMIVVNNAPVLHWTSLFKPSSWGWFISEDIGMSWLWWMRIFLIFTGFFLLFRELAQNTMMGLCTAVFMVFNPLFVHWSYVFCEISAFGSLATYFAIQIFKSDDYKKIFFWMLPLGYVAAAAVFQLYPAYLIPAIWAFLFMFISWGVSDLKRLRAASLKINLVRFFAIFSGIFLTLLCTYGLIDSLGDAYTLITNAAYPGARNEKGGDGRLISLFINYLSLTRIRDLTQYVGNICEGSNFICLLPFTLSIGIVHLVRMRSLPGAYVLLVFANLVFYCWYFFGFPELLASISGFNKAPTTRSLFGLLILDAALLVSSARLATNLWINDKNSAVVAFGIWALCAAAVFEYLRQSGVQTTHSFRFYQTLVVILATTSLFFWRPSLSLAGLALLMHSNNTRFNPIQQGATKLESKAFSIALSNAVSKIDFNRKSDSVLVFGDLIGNVPRAIGIKSIGGTMFYPQPSWLSSFGLSTSNPIVNRYAHVVVERAPQGAEPSAVLRHNDAFTLMIDPYNSKLLFRVGVKIVGTRNQEKPRLLEGEFTLLSEGGGYSFYQPNRD